MSESANAELNRDAIENWLGKLEAQGLVEPWEVRSSSTWSKGSDDYEVIYEIAVEPVSLNKPRVEVWITSDGDIGMGFETFERMAERMRVRHARRGFATGFEPAACDVRTALKVLDLVARGKIFLRASVWPVFGVVSFNAYLHREDVPTNGETSDLLKSWLHSWKEQEDMSGRIKFLEFEPWTGLEPELPK